mmetsp:Transcript_21936/g.36732  ORF Transcript_21936/g.36732 Transcript_21936/m.36732 type:complete len:231 (+) Transcript_21936:67-759(+)
MASTIESYFRIGRLRFGTHGILGILGTALNIVALMDPKQSFTVFSLLVTTTLLAWEAQSLIPQVPEKTRISKWIVAPHREAFQRTIAIIFYTNLRIFKEMNWIPIWGRSITYPIMLFVSWLQFSPIGSDFTNGNTWIFVMPMFSGVTYDAIQQQLGGETFVSLKFLLFTELSALLIAFVFTLAFRSYVNIKVVYAVSALCVAGLLSCVFNIVTIIQVSTLISSYMEYKLF